MMPIAAVTCLVSPAQCTYVFIALLFDTAHEKPRFVEALRNTI